MDGSDDVKVIWEIKNPQNEQTAVREYYTIWSDLCNIFKCKINIKKNMISFMKFILIFEMYFWFCLRL